MDSPKRQYVRDLLNDQTVDDYFAVALKGSPKDYKNGIWFQFKISDKTGSIDAKYWGGPDRESVSRVFSSFKTGDVVHISGGRTSTYQGSLEIHLNEASCGISRIDEYDLAELAATTEKDIPNMISSFHAEIDSMKNPHIKKLLGLVFDDELMTKYAAAPAASSYHHNYRGGLLEHVSGMILIAKALAVQYPDDLDSDLLVAGCMLHDIGKLHEYSAGATIGFTTRGNLLGHIPMGAKMVEDAIDKIDGFPDVLRVKILHLILSHHGSLDRGSPVEPRFPEAMALHKIDDCDAQTKNAIQVKKEEIAKKMPAAKTAESGDDTDNNDNDNNDNNDIDNRDDVSMHRQFGLVYLK